MAFTFWQGLSLYTKPQVKNKYHGTAKAWRAWRTYCIKRKELSTYHTEQQPTLYHRDEYRRHVQRLFFWGKRSIFYTWLPVFKHELATLTNINTSSGKAVFFFSSGTRELDTAGMRGFSRVPGVVTFWENETENTKLIGKLQNLKHLYISTNYCLLTRNQTFILTQIHKCKRSDNRLFKGYLLNIYMKHKYIFCWRGCRLNISIQPKDGF